MNSVLRNCFPAVCLLVASSSVAPAQLVSVRTAPVVVAEQFFTFPSRLMGMGGGLALQDLEMDPFANPATGSRIHGGLATTSPTVYNLPENSGFGRTFPLAMLYGNGTTFGAASFAAQELESAHRQGGFWGAPVTTRSDRFSHNTYAVGMLGTHLSNNRGAIGFSASYSSLESVHAVDLLYPQADAIDQEGSISDFRVGYLRDFSAGRALEAVIVRNHIDMEHDVTYVDRRWTQTGQIITSPPRVELNRDKTTTWGAHIKYGGALEESDWRLAGAFTANMKTHPKIPNYEFMSIRRDPGDSWALRFGIGAANVDSVTTWAFDLSYEPAWTYTWAEAADPVARPAGDTLPRGAMTIENDFSFSNTNFHVGWMRRMDRVFGLQAGMGVRRVNYWLDQYNHITQQPRQQDESWTELNFSWGATFDFAGIQVRYFGRRSGGAPQLVGQSDEALVSAPQPGVDIVAAPSGPLNMNVTTVHTHQLGVSIPFGRLPQRAAKAD
jgi:hypothetical protein